MADVAPDSADVRMGVTYIKDDLEIQGTYDGSDQYSTVNQSDVRSGVLYVTSGQSVTGTLQVPDPFNVLEGIPTDDTVGTLVVPADGGGQGSDQPDVVLPDPSDVKHGVVVGDSVGTYRGADLWTSLAANVVKKGITFLADGISMIGTYDARPTAPALSANLINYSVMEAKFASLISLLLSQSAGVTVPAIWAKQSRPQPVSKPYASLQYTQGPTKIGQDQKNTLSDGTSQISGFRELILGVSVFGTGAYSMLTDLQNANEFDSVRDSFALAGIVFVSASQVRDLSQIEGSSYQTRGQMDVTFRVNAIAVDSASGYIDSVKIDNEIDGSTEVVTG